MHYLQTFSMISRVLTGAAVRPLLLPIIPYDRVGGPSVSAILFVFVSETTPCFILFRVCYQPNIIPKEYKNNEQQTIDTVQRRNIARQRA